MAEASDPKWKGPALSISLDVTEPAKAGDKWEFTAVATVLYHRRHPPDPQREVVFFVNADEIDRGETDEENGRVATTILLPEPGSYLVTAYLADFPGLRATKRVMVKKGEAEIPTELLIEQAGRSGNYALTITVLSVKGAGMAHRALRIQDPKASPATSDVQTGDDGTYKHDVQFTDRERFITVLVLGTKLSKTVRLFWPRT